MALKPDLVIACFGNNDVAPDNEPNYVNRLPRVFTGGYLQEKLLSLAIYRKGVALAEKQGIIIADTKFEFGWSDGELILIDEVLTPDSSRFWPVETYAPGGAQRSFDKQYVRDYLLSLNWEKKPPAPSLPGEVIAKTRAKYLDALRHLTGSTHGL